MTAKSHIVTNFNFALLPMLLFPDLIFSGGYHNQYYLFLAGVLFGSLFPDIDEPNSSLGKKVWFLSKDINLLIGHRTFTHNILLYMAIALFSFILMEFEHNEIFFLFGFCLGSVFHILEDSITNGGVKKALRPFVKNFTLVPETIRFNTNGKFENFIYIPVVSIILLAQALKIGQDLL